MKKAKITCWDWEIISALLLLRQLTLGILILFIWPTLGGENILSLNYWMGTYTGLTPFKILLLLIGTPYLFIWTIYQLFINFGRLILAIFTEKDICLYSLNGVRTIPWVEISAFTIDQIENSPGRKSKSFKYFEVKLSTNHEQDITFVFETFSDTKADLILKLREN
jgi:hypothetical protein